RGAQDARSAPLVAIEPDHASDEIDRDAIAAQELVADDAAELKAEERARRVQVQHHHRDLREADRLELEVHVRQQERVLVPSRRAVDLERNAAERPGTVTCPAVTALIEINSPPVST